MRNIHCKICFHNAFTSAFNFAIIISLIELLQICFSALVQSERFPNVYIVSACIVSNN